MPMLTKREAPVKLAAPVVKSSAILPTKNTIDESRTFVSTNEAPVQISETEIIEIPSDTDSDEYFSEAEAAGTEAPSGDGTVPIAAPVITKVNGNDNEPLGSDDEDSPPTFGELLRDHGAIDPPASLKRHIPDIVAVQPARTTIAPPPHQSLTTVLTQALKTDDAELLESCLHTTDLTIVRNTIERIDSSLAIALLTKLAARLYRRPGRAESLMAWVQWTLILHGGALSSQPKVIHSLNGLQKVLSERAKGLTSLLALKGRLDMLDLQLDIRRKMRRGSDSLRQGEANSEQVDEAENSADEDDNVIWVEGEGDHVSRKQFANGTKSRRRRGDDEDDVENDRKDDGIPLINDIGASEDEEEDSDVEEIDDTEPAEELLDEDKSVLDHEDEDLLAEAEESDVEAGPPSKMQKVGKSFSRRE